jgi:hypothetical protein
VGPSLLAWWLSLVSANEFGLGFRVEVVTIMVDGVVVKQIWLEIHNNSDHTLGLEDDATGSALGGDGDWI